jgi:nucleoside-diphosphate-sugar epimerase
VVILGAGGKMGPSLARMARRAIADRSRRVLAVSRFSDARVADALARDGVTVVRADLADPAQVAALPWAPNVLWLAGQKFGTAGDPVGTWTHNVVASVHAAERFAGARVVCFSTGNVYGRTPVARGGAREADALVPDGEYAASTIGRERVFAAVARRTGSPLLLYRLFYACDLRYGIVTELARRVLARTPIDLATGWVNVIWQGDANRLALRALAAADTPPVALNVTGPMVAVRALAERLGAAAGEAPVFVGTEAPDALVANVDALQARLGRGAGDVELPGRLADDGHQLVEAVAARDVAQGRLAGGLLDQPVPVAAVQAGGSGTQRQRASKPATPIVATHQEQTRSAP